MGRMVERCVYGSPRRARWRMLPAASNEPWCSSIATHVSRQAIATDVQFARNAKGHGLQMGV